MCKKMSEEKILELSIAAKQKDRIAFDELCYFSRKGVEVFIKNSLYKYYINDAELAEDIFQNTFVKLWENIHKLDLNIERGFIKLAYYFASCMVKTEVKKMKVNRTRYSDNLDKDSNDVFDKVSNDCDNPEYVFFNNINGFEWHDIILQTLFSHGGKPHQVLVFCFNKILYSYISNTTNGSSQYVLQVFSNHTLSNVSIQFENSYTKHSGMDKLILHDCMLPLRNDMEAYINNIKIADSFLNDYFTLDIDGNLKNPPANIYDWSEKVKKRLIKHIVKNHNYFKNKYGLYNKK